MGEDPERIEQEIERTRAKLGDDLDALEEKVNPKKVAHRSVDRARDKVADLKDKVTGATSAARDKAAVRSGMDPETADTREVAMAVAGGTWATVREQTRRNPLAVGAVAFVIGFVLGH